MRKIAFVQIARAGIVASLMAPLQAVADVPAGFGVPMSQRCGQEVATWRAQRRVSQRE